MLGLFLPPPPHIHTSSCPAGAQHRSAGPREEARWCVSARDVYVRKEEKYAPVRARVREERCCVCARDVRQCEAGVTASGEMSTRAIV